MTHGSIFAPVLDVKRGNVGNRSPTRSIRHHPIVAPDCIDGKNPRNSGCIGSRTGAVAWLPRPERLTGMCTRSSVSAFSSTRRAKKDIFIIRAGERRAKKGRYPYISPVGLSGVPVRLPLEIVRDLERDDPLYRQDSTSIGKEAFLRREFHEQTALADSERPLDRLGLTGP